MLNAPQDSGGVNEERAIDLDRQFQSKENNDGKAPVELGESDRLLFARQILLWLVIVTMFSFAAYVLAPDNKGAAQIFELIKVGVLPLVTLVIGFYFPNSRR
jgi:hypothetical protein